MVLRRAHRLCLRPTVETIVFRARQYPQVSRFLVRFPYRYGQPGRPTILRLVSGSSSHRHPAQSLELNFLFTVPVSTTGPSRVSSVETLQT